MPITGWTPPYCSTLLEGADRVEYSRSIEAAHAALGEREFAAAWAEGGAMTVDEAIVSAWASPVACGPAARDGAAYQ